MPVRECPDCSLVHPTSAVQCECGYSFATDTRSAPPAEPEKQSADRVAKLYTKFVASSAVYLLLGLAGYVVGVLGTLGIEDTRAGVEAASTAGGRLFNLLLPFMAVAIYYTFRMARATGSSGLWAATLVFLPVGWIPLILLGRRARRIMRPGFEVNLWRAKALSERTGGGLGAAR